MNPSNSDFAERYSRQTMLGQLGPEGQLRLAAASVLVVGLGGLGSPVATYLTAAGIGRIGLCDPDVVSLSNLQRQTLYTADEVGLPKAECALRRLRAQSPSTHFDLHPRGITPANASDLVEHYDIVADCTDNFATRYLIDDACERSGRPWVHGAIGGFTGQVSVFGHTAGRRYRELYPDREALEAIPARAEGVLGALPCVVGGVMASEVLKIAGGFGQPMEGRLFTIDLLTMQTALINF